MNVKTWMLTALSLLVVACNDQKPDESGDVAPAVRDFYVSFEAVGVEEPWQVAGKLRVPQGIEGPMPAVVIVHGSNGVDTRGDYHASSLNAHGIATLEIDLWAARQNFSGAGGRPQAVSETLPDAYGALSFLAALPFINSDKIGIMGFSWGGVVSMLTATKPYTDLYAQDNLHFAAHVPFYPVCWVYNTIPGYEFADLTGAPVMILAGAEDDYDAPDTCPALVSSLPPEAQSHVTVTVYPGATHGWNMQGNMKAVVEDPFSHLGQGGEVRIFSNPEIAEKSRLATDAFFLKVFGITGKI